MSSVRDHDGLSNVYTEVRNALVSILRASVHCVHTKTTVGVVVAVVVAVIVVVVVVYSGDMELLFGSPVLLLCLRDGGLYSMFLEENSVLSCLHSRIRRQDPPQGTATAFRTGVRKLGLLWTSFCVPVVVVCLQKRAELA